MNRFAVALLLSITCLSGCSKKLKEKVGFATPGPNEYSVNREKALEIPPHYDLPLPGKPITEHEGVSRSLDSADQTLLDEINKK